MEVKRTLKDEGRTLNGERSFLDYLHRSSFRVHRSDRGGSALIMVLWVIGLLAMLVASFAFDARIEARLTSYYRNRTKADYLARSGLEIAELIMSKSNGMSAGADVDEDKAASDEWYMYAKGLADGTVVTVEHDLAEAGVGEGTITVVITPEPARINVNVLTGDRRNESDQRWEGIFDVAGVPEEMWAELIESFYDWTDKDDNSWPEGAESDYYEGLDEPYTARNGPLDTVGELRLIKGFSKEILYGGALGVEGGFEDQEIQCSGIADMLTTYGDGKINVNAASRRVLMTLPGIDGDIVDLIEDERAGWTDDSGVNHDESFTDTGDFFSRIPEIDNAVKNMVSTQSKFYRLMSTGEINGVPRSLWCIVQFSGRNFTVLSWREDD